MIAERTEKNNDLFIEKGNIQIVDIIFMYKGVYRVMNSLNISKYESDTINIITKRDNGEDF